MKIIELNLSKAITVQREQFEPINSFYAIKATIEEGDDLEKEKEKLNEILQKWAEFEILKWKSPNRAITSGRKLGLFNAQNNKPPF